MKVDYAELKRLATNTPPGQHVKRVLRQDIFAILADREADQARIAELEAAMLPENWRDAPDQWTPEIEAAHPVNSTAADRHRKFEIAMEMVSNRRGKYELVGLAHWLLTRAQSVEAESARLREASEAALDMLIELNPSNYTHDDVMDANSATVAAILRLHAALSTHQQSEAPQ